MENILLTTLMSCVTLYGSHIGLKKKKLNLKYVINSPWGIKGDNDIIGEVVFQP